MNADDLFTAPQVAKICSTDLKTIHNWVNRGEIKSFRTPGRHLRFRREDILDFLTRFGYPIPDGFSPAKQRIVLFDNNEASMKSLKRLLSREFEIEAFLDLVDATLAIGRNPPDLVLINGETGKDAEVMHLVARLTSKKDGCPVAVFNQNGNREEAARGAGALEFIPSADTKEIRQRISVILGK
jgi:excisionase family DNA binding protein